MPIYEYACPRCGHRFEKFVRRPDQAQPPACPECGAADVPRAMSTFGAIGLASTGTSFGAASSASCAPSG
jgi:putative FmdB family regulatory protein